MGSLKLETATIELISKCNFDCKHCYLDEKNSLSLSFTEWIKVIDILHEAGIKSIVLTGGEPLLHPNFKEIYLYIWNLGLDIMLFTNGSMINDTLIKFFSKNTPKSISISIYGHNQEQYDFFTGLRSAVFEKIMINIKKLKNEDINVFLGITPYRYSIDISWFDFIKDNAIEINTYMIPSLSKQSNLKYRLTPNEIVKIETMVQRQIKITEVPITKNNPDYYRKCGGGITSIFVDPSGFTSMCALNRKSQFNILVDHFESIKLGVEYENQLIKEKYFKGLCGSCKHNAGCRNCPMYSELEGRIDGGNPYLCSLLLERKRACK